MVSGLSSMSRAEVEFVMSLPQGERMVGRRAEVLMSAVVVNLQVSVRWMVKVQFTVGCVLVIVEEVWGGHLVARIALTYGDGRV